MLSYAWDLPNRYSLIGLVCAVAGIYFAILGVNALCRAESALTPP
jgi:hypothetical protein